MFKTVYFGAGGERMIAYFPDAYENELLYSWLARYYQKSGYIAYRDAAEDLFVKPTVRPDVEFINPLTKAQ